MATSVFYNGITLGNVLTREFDQTIVRDPSHTDKWYSTFRITVEAVANASILAAAVQNLGVVGSGVVGTIPGEVVKTARQLLAEDRGTFIYYQDGIEILKSDPTLDADNGPKVSNLRITHTSQATVRVNFTIECALVDCQNGRPPTEVVGNRWSSTDDYGEDFRCTRTWRGLLRLGTMAASPHHFRGLVVPPLQAGWRRSHMNFIGETNGLELGYEITDQQLMGDAAPWPAAKMSLSHTEGFTVIGCKGFVNFSLRLEGIPGADRSQMIAWGLSLMVAKLSVNPVNTRQIVKQLAVTEHNGDSSNSVEIMAQLERLPFADSAGAVGGVQAAFGAMAFTQLGGSLQALNLSNYDVTQSVYPGLSGNATMAGLFAAYLQGPCGYQAHNINTGAVTPTLQDADIDRDTQSGTQATYTQAPIPDSLRVNSYSQSTLDGIYLHAKINSSYDIDDGRVFLPIAKGGGRFGDGGASLVPVRLNPQTARRIIHVEYERIGQPPEIWKLDDFIDSNGIANYFDGCKPEFQPPQTLGDGSILYAVDATYRFALSRAPRDGERYSAGSLPWDTTATTDNGYSTANFIPGGDPKGP